MYERESSRQALIYRFPPPTWRKWPLLWLREHRLDSALLFLLSALALLLSLFTFRNPIPFVVLEMGLLAAFHFLEKRVLVSFAKHWLSTGERVVIPPQRQRGLGLAEAEIMDLIAHEQHQGMMDIVASGTEHYHGFPYMKEYHTTVWCWVLFCYHLLSPLLVRLRDVRGNTNIYVGSPATRSGHYVHQFTYVTGWCLTWMKRTLHSTLPILAALLCMWTLAAVMLCPPNAGSAVGCTLLQPSCFGTVPVSHGGPDCRDSMRSSIATVPPPGSQCLSSLVRPGATSCWHGCGRSWEQSPGAWGPTYCRHLRDEYANTSSEVLPSNISYTVGSAPSTRTPLGQCCRAAGHDAGQFHSVDYTTTRYVSSLA